MKITIKDTSDVTICHWHNNKLQLIVFTYGESTK